MYFNFYPNIDLVRGKYRSLIVDIKDKQIYEINNKFYKILELLRRGHHIEEVTTNSEIIFEKLKLLELNSIGSILRSCYECILCNRK